MATSQCSDGGEVQEKVLVSGTYGQKKELGMVLSSHIHG